MAAAEIALIGKSVQLRPGLEPEQPWQHALVQDYDIETGLHQVVDALGVVDWVRVNAAGAVPGNPHPSLSPADASDYVCQDLTTAKITEGVT